MFELRQNVFTLFLLLCLLSCSSNPKPPIEPQNNTFISKPEVTFNLKSLPKQINVFYFNSRIKRENTSQLLQGITSNYYYYKEKIGYIPELNFIDLSNECLTDLNLKKDAFSVGLFLNYDSAQLNNNCYSEFIKTNGLVVSNSKNNSFKNERFTSFNISRKLDIKNSLNIAKKNGNLRTIIIDDPGTGDKDFLSKKWKEMDGEIISTATSGDKISSQKLLSEILLLEQSQIRSRKLSRIIGSEITNSPRKRDDIDSIFLSTSLANARSIKPALEYNFADNLSVYFIPSWNESDYLTTNELDLENVIITEMPFLLHTSTTFQKIDNTNKTRNFAIGYDSFELILLLNSDLKRNFEYFGLTGLITYNSSTIKRTALSAKVIKGKLDYLDYKD